MAIPRTVQKQLDQADALIAAQQTQEPAAPVVTDASQLVPPQPPATPAPPPPPVVEPPPPPAIEPWEQKFKTLQGMFNTEVPRLTAENKRLESQVVALTEQMRALASASKPPEPQKPAVDPRDVENFGTELMDMVQRYISATTSTLKAEIANLAGTFDSRLEKLEQTVSGVSHKTETTLETQFYASLADQVPDWKQINDSPRWLSWLSEVDDVYGVPRQAALDAAHQSLDSGRVAAIFKKFKALQPVTPSAETLVAPAAAAGGPGATPTQTAKPIIASKFIHNFYADMAKGRYRGREAEAQRIEAEINIAVSEGRVA